jgi:DNA polymerase-3 subunit alpha (Gram-positive type)
MTSNDIERNHFDKVCNGSLVKAFQKCGFDIDTLPDIIKRFCLS